MGEDESLNPIQRKILIRMARKGASPHCNFRLETIQNGLYRAERIHVSKEINELITMGLVFEYRSKNYGLTKRGMMVAHELLNREIEDLGYRIIK